jgi:pyruvate formate lyase activating enzyme
MTMPAVASAQLHPAPPSSYTVFMAGCNFKCLNCQNWSISCVPDLDTAIRGAVDPAELAEECVATLAGFTATLIEADRIFFSGGAPDIHLPYVEEVVRLARELEPATRVNFDTNGYLTEASFERVLGFATSLTYDLKAFDDEVHLALTGAHVHPVLRNAGKLGRDHPEQLWEYRILVIPGITEDQVAPLCDFVAAIDGSLPVCFLAFRPNYVLDSHPGASRAAMDHCLEIARRAGLDNAHWAGTTDLPGRAVQPAGLVEEVSRSASARAAASRAMAAGCVTHPRSCRACEHSCPMRGFVPTRVC